MTVLYLCRSCSKSFVSQYACYKIEGKNGVSSFRTELQYIGPSGFSEKSFGPEIADCSPQFVKIYNQALEAESQDLNEIAGLGYRKAMEFLMKDFCIHKNPDDQESIKAMPLAQCIQKYIDSVQIKTLATRAAWIGNDEAHYIRKQEDRDVQDMKRFIEAAVHFISMDLIYEDAESISRA